jgi:hypothetical protein
MAAAVGGVPVYGAHRCYRGLRGSADGLLGDEAAAHRDRVGDDLRVAHGKRAGVVAAAAVPDDRNAAAAARVQRGRSPRDLHERPLGAVDVEQEPRGRRPVADASQPRRERRERVVPGKEAGQQQDRAAVPARDAAAVEDRVREQAHGLELPAQLMEVAPPPAPGVGHQANALWPVMSRPTISAWIVSVPS